MLSRLTVVLFLIISFWGMSLFFVVISSSQYNPIKSRLPFDGKTLSTIIFPEGWSFFTRDPREEWIDAYSYENKLLQPVLYRCSDPENLFGLSKNFKVRNLEIHKMLERLSIQDSLWMECNGNILDCISQLHQNDSLSFFTYVIDNSLETQLLCGDVWVQKKVPVPWAWSKSRERIFMPSKLLRLKIICEQLESL